MEKNKNTVIVLQINNDMLSENLFRLAGFMPNKTNGFIKKNNTAVENSASTATFQDKSTETTIPEFILNIPYKSENVNS